MPALIDLTDQRFGQLKVIERARNKGKDSAWRCRCDCGKEIEVRSFSLKNGDNQGCGCLQRKRVGEANTKHGGTKTRLYRIWEGMHTRCNNPNRKRYPAYGGRGITVCQEWRDFATFRDWALTNGYQDDLTIDRKDNDGNYEPGNCRWATQVEQQNNRRNNRKGMREKCLGMTI
jgi:hypothetical protein